VAVEAARAQESDEDALGVSPPLPDLQAIAMEAARFASGASPPLPDL
jgi:hypothetical protein